jgi:hypothetical protein
MASMEIHTHTHTTSATSSVAVAPTVDYYCHPPSTVGVISISSTIYPYLQGAWPSERDVGRSIGRSSVASDTESRPPHISGVLTCSAEQRAHT